MESSSTSVELSNNNWKKEGKTVVTQINLNSVFPQFLDDYHFHAQMKRENYVIE